MPANQEVFPKATAALNEQDIASTLHDLQTMSISQCKITSNRRIIITNNAQKYIGDAFLAIKNAAAEQKKNAPRPFFEKQSFDRNPNTKNEEEENDDSSVRSEIQAQSGRQEKKPAPCYNDDSMDIENSKLKLS